MTPNVLSIAGSDPSGGAGVQADLKTFAALKCHGMAVLTALTAQNTRGVSAIHIPPPAFVAQQIDAILVDIEVHAIKIGMLANAAIVAAVADRLRAHKPVFLVLDPVLVATSGDALGAPDVVEAMQRELFPLADLITPNIPEAARLTGLPEPREAQDMLRLAEALRDAGARAVLIKGGHLDGDVAQDFLLADGQHHVFSAPRIATRNTHGTGCTLSSAIAAYSAHRMPLIEAVAAAKTYLTGALRGAEALQVGGGHGPVNHFWDLWPKP